MIWSHDELSISGNDEGIRGQRQRTEMLRQEMVSEIGRKVDGMQ